METTEYGQPLRLMPSRPWTHEKIKRFKELWKMGVPAKMIAAELGVTPGSLAGMRYRLGMVCRTTKVTVPKTFRPWSQEEIDRAVEMKRLKKPVPHIAMALGRTPTSVYCKLKSLNEEWLKYTADKKIEIPQKVLDIRDRHLSAPYRDLSGAVFGDPVVGRSALDRKLAAQGVAA